MKKSIKTFHFHEVVGFTLIELLVVIVILGMLMGFIIPSFFGTKNKANIAKAKWGAKQVELAWNEYFNNYRKWPAIVTANAVELIPDAALTRILAGENVANDNPREIMFFDSITNAVMDPWANFYWVQFDHDYDNRIDLCAEAGGNAVRKSVAVWTVYRGESSTNIIGSWQ